MALIYANAVNKRINNPSLKTKKKNTRPCSVLDDSSVASAYEGQTRKLSREGALARKSTPRRAGENEVSQFLKPHKFISYNQRVVCQYGLDPDRYIAVKPAWARCSCYEVAERDDEEVLRKTSHPVIYQSASQPINKKSNDERRAEARKNLIQKYNLEHGYDEPLPHCENRRRSVSLGPDQWRDRIGTAEEKQKKNGAFQKMKRKLSKWKLGGRTE